MGFYRGDGRGVVVGYARWSARQSEQVFLRVSDRHAFQQCFYSYLMIMLPPKRPRIWELNQG